MTFSVVNNKYILIYSWLAVFTAELLQLYFWYSSCGNLLFNMDTPVAFKNVMHMFEIAKCDSEQLAALLLVS